MDFPADFKLVEEQGIDSYVGKVVGDSIEFQFDYGYYSGNGGSTLKEYLEDKSWLEDAKFYYIGTGGEYDGETMPEIEVLSIRPAVLKDSALGEGFDFVAKCQHKDKVFEYPIDVPENIKDAELKRDTIHYQRRGISIAKNPKVGRTSMHIRDLSSYDKSMEAYLALYIASDSISKSQQETVLKIFSTVRPIR
jgi:hypothetical protein